MGNKIWKELSNDGRVQFADWDWDYQPGNGQWVCKGIQTERYASPDGCAMNLKDDNRWPG